MTKNNHEYDVALSYAGEDRDYVRRVANFLERNHVKLFYDEYEQLNLWGKELYNHLDEVYRSKARYCIMFISSAYKNKLWTNHERESAQARAFQENNEYILPAKFDDTSIPGIRPTTGYIDLQKMSPEEFGDLILKKIGKETGTIKTPANSEFRKPKIGKKSFNPYSEALRFIDLLADEFKRKFDLLSEQDITLAVFDRGSHKCLRMVSDGKTVYSLDLWLGGIAGDSSIGFYGRRGSIADTSTNTSNAWAKIVFDEELNSTVIEFNDMSLLNHVAIGKSQRYTYTDFINSLWDQVCDVLENSY